MPTYLCSAKFVQQMLNPGKALEPVHPHVPGYYSREDKIERLLLRFKDELHLSEEQLEMAKLILKDNI